MDRFDELRVFVAVAEQGGFARAARRLSISPPGVTRAIASLEERIGTQLFRRTTRVVRLTQAGQRFLGDARRILTELEDAEASAAGLHSKLGGPLAVTAPLLFGRRFVAPIALDFLRSHADVTVRLLLVDRLVDLLDEGIDVAVRIAELPDSAWSAVRVGTVRRVVFAAPRFLARHGVPKRPADLRGLPAIVFSSGATPGPWAFRTGSRVEHVEPSARLIVDNAEVAIAAAVAGHGVCGALSYQIADELARGRLRVLLAEFAPPALPIQLIHREGRRGAARVRAFIDLAVERLRADRSLGYAVRREAQD